MVAELPVMKADAFKHRGYSPSFFSTLAGCPAPVCDGELPQRLAASGRGISLVLTPIWNVEISVDLSALTGLMVLSAWVSILSVCCFRRWTYSQLCTMVWMVLCPHGFTSAMVV